MMQTRVESASECLREAAELLRAGEVVAFPTETVYGLGGDARSEEAVRRIYAAKGRPGTNPVIVHVADAGAAQAAAEEWPAQAALLARQFWPGPLTVIVRRGPSLSPLVSAGRATVALRCPDHPIAQALLRAANMPIAAPSANRSGFISPTTAAHVYAELAGRIPLILDGGPTRIGVESTVLDLSASPPAILRPGAVTAEMLQPHIGPVTTAREVVGDSLAARSPGTFARHYAPRKSAYRFTGAAWEAAQAFAAAHAPQVLLTHDDSMVLPAPHETIRLPDDPEEYARALYAALHSADNLPAQAILILMPTSSAGLWQAITDRLQRATTPLADQR